jgi:hypothetical protein
MEVTSVGPLPSVIMGGQLVSNYPSGAPTGGLQDLVILDSVQVVPRGQIHRPIQQSRQQHPLPRPLQHPLRHPVSSQFPAQEVGVFTVASHSDTRNCQALYGKQGLGSGLLSLHSSH